MPTNAAHDRWWQISEVVFGVPLRAAIAPQLVVPLPSPGVLPTPAVVARGIGLFVVGVALIVLAVNLVWMLILLLPALVACHYVLIAPEERYLAGRFADEYRAYTAAVHRWFGRAH
jgi:hypothetical protein